MKKILLSAALIAASFTTFAQVGIGTTKPKGALDVVSTNSALILPRVANTAAVTTPVNGMIIYDLSAKCFKGYQNGGWSDCGFATSAAAAAAAASEAVLTQIGNEGDSPDTVNSVVTVAQLGDILPSIIGLYTGNETAYQDYIDDNPGSFSSPATQAEVKAMVDAVNTIAGSATVVDVAGQNGTVWMDRNLGATQQATSSTDAAAYGDLYQWGRSADGHQIRTSATTSSQSATSTPAHGDFIIGSSDWLTTQDDTLWKAGSNDPCPSGYRIPTETELNNERLAFRSNNAAGAYASALKLPLAGYRIYTNGTLGAVGGNGFYWSSTVNGPAGRSLFFDSSNSFTGRGDRAFGDSVRCIKE